MSSAVWLAERIIFKRLSITIFFYFRAPQTSVNLMVLMTVMWLPAARFLGGLRDFLQTWLLGATAESVFPCITELQEHNLGPAYGHQTASLIALIFLTVITLKWHVCAKSKYEFPIGLNAVKIIDIVLRLSSLNAVYR